MSNPFGPSLLFAHHPDSLWIYDVDTLAVLDANNAALQAYGYTRAEFMALAADRISPKGLPAADQISGVPKEPTRHIRERTGGQPRVVDVTTQPVDFAGRPAILVLERDVTQLVDIERENEASRRREADSREKAEASARNFLALFEAVPGRYLVVKPETFEIIAASDSFLEATKMTRSDLYGLTVFNVFPTDASEHGAADAGGKLRASMERVASLVH